MEHALEDLEELDCQIADYDRDIQNAAELTSLLRVNRHALTNARQKVLMRVKAMLRNAIDQRLRNSVDMVQVHEDALLRDAIARRVTSSAVRAEASETERRVKEEAEQKAKAEAERTDNGEKAHAKAVARKRARSNDRNEPLQPTTRLLWPKTLKAQTFPKYLPCNRLATRCDVCNEVDPEKLSVIMVGDKNYSNRRTLCLDCTNPACTAPDCTTCTICRNPACNHKGQCAKQVALLTSSQHPKSMADKLSFRCSACRRMKCSICRIAATRKQQQRHRKKNTTKAWACGDCLAAAKA